jgi:long-chain acyl-CoA synthetase
MGKTPEADTAMARKTLSISAQLKGKYPPYPSQPISDIRDMFLQSTQKFGDRTALQYKKVGRWLPITYRGMRDSVEQIACGLAALGLEPVQGKLAIIGDNRPEWATAYLAAACTGIVCVPIDRDLKATEVFNILGFSRAQALICDDKHLEMVLGLRGRLPDLAHIFNMDETRPADVIRDFSDLKRLGAGHIRDGHNDFDKRTVTPDHVLSILFTSGTMGNPKAVMLTHGNVASNLVDAVRWVNLRMEDRFLSVLPIHHSYECTDGFLLAIYLGATTSYAENLRRIPENLAESRSTVMLGVPMLWHAMYGKIEAAMEEKGIWKVNAAKRLAAFLEKALGLNIRRLLFSKVHRRFGGCLRLLISGGAAIEPAVARGFRELGIEFLQGYGLTESAPIIAVNRNKAFRDDAAGLPLASVEIRIAEDGEILASGPNIMKGYYENPEATRETLEDGWLHTGDLGYLDADGFLHIQGRKKAVIVTPAGKKIYPEEVEAEILKSPCISECLVWGQAVSDPTQEPAIEAIVVPNKEHFGTQVPQAPDAGERNRIESLVRQEVKERCRNLAAYKRITRLTVSHEELEKTTTKKVKRYLYAGGSIGSDTRKSRE